MGTEGMLIVGETALIHLPFLACTDGNAKNGAFKSFHDQLIQDKRYSDHVASHAMARRIATLAFGVMKNGKKFDEGKLKLDNKK